MTEFSAHGSSPSAYRVRSGSSGTPTGDASAFPRSAHSKGHNSPSNVVVRLSGESLGISADLQSTSLGDDGGGKYTLYHIAVKAPCGDWAVSRRFREFDSLHSTLRTKTPPSQQRSLPPLPPKRVFGTMDASVIAERKSQLGHFLRRLMTLPGLLAAVPELVVFLDDSGRPLRAWLSMQSMNSHLWGLQSAYAQSQAQISALESRLNTLESKPRAPSTDTHEAGRAAMEAALAGLGSASPAMRAASPPPQHGWQRGLGASPFMEHVSSGLELPSGVDAGGGMQRGWGGVPSLPAPVSISDPPLLSFGNSSGASVTRAQQMVTRCLRATNSPLPADCGPIARTFAHAGGDHLPELHAAVDVLISAVLGVYKGLAPPPSGMTHLLLTLAQGGANARAYTAGATAAGVSPVWQQSHITVLTSQGAQGSTLHRIAAAASSVCQLARRWQAQGRASAGRAAAFASARSPTPHEGGQRGVRSVSGTLLQSFSGAADFDAAGLTTPPSRNRSTASAAGGLQGAAGGGSLSRRVSAQSWTMDGRRRGSSVASASFTVGGGRVRAVNAALSAMDKSQLLTGSTPRAGGGSEAPPSTQQLAVQHTTALAVACMGMGNETAARMAAGTLAATRAPPALLQVKQVRLAWPHQEPLVAASELHLVVGPGGGPGGRVSTNDLRGMSCAALVHAMSEHIGDEHALFRRSLVLLHAWGSCDASRWGHQWACCSQDEGLRAFDPSVAHFELPWEACVTLLSWTFARRGAVISTPLQALAWTLLDAAAVPWATHVLETQGITPRTEVAWTSRMAAAQAVAAALSATARRVPLAERSASDEVRGGGAGAAERGPKHMPVDAGSRFLNREEAVAAAGAAVAPIFAELEAWGQEGGVEWPDESAASSVSASEGGVTSDAYGMGAMAWLGLDDDQDTVYEEGGARGGSSGANVPLPSSPRMPPHEHSNSNLGSQQCPKLPYSTLTSLRRKCGRRRAAEDVALCITLMRQWGAAGDERGVLGLPLHVAHSMVAQVVDAAVEGGAGGSVSGAPMGIMHPCDPLLNTLQGWSREQCVALQRSFATGAALLSQALQQEHGTPGWEGAYRGSNSIAVHLLMRSSWERCLRSTRGTAGGSSGSSANGDGVEQDVGRLLGQVQGQCSTPEGRAGARSAAVAAVRRGAPAPALWHAVEFGAFYLDSDVTDAALLMLTREVLLTRGPLPVGEVGKHLGEATSNGNLSAALKEKFGGLKKFLERHAGEFLLGADHPFNPHVYLRALFTPEQTRQIEQSSTPLIPGQGGLQPGTQASSNASSGRKRRGGRRGKSAAAAAAAAAASAATAAVASAPLHTLVAPQGGMMFTPGYTARSAVRPGTTPPSPHSGSLGSSFVDYDDSASRGSDSSSTGGGFATPPPRSATHEGGTWGAGLQHPFGVGAGQGLAHGGTQFGPLWGQQQPPAGRAKE